MLCWVISKCTAIFNSIHCNFRCYLFYHKNKEINQVLIPLKLCELLESKVIFNQSFKFKPQGKK